MICETINCNNQVDNPFEDDFCDVCAYEDWKLKQEEMEEDYHEAFQGVYHDDY